MQTLRAVYRCSNHGVVKPPRSAPSPRQALPAGDTDAYTQFRLCLASAQQSWNLTQTANSLHGTVAAPFCRWGRKHAKHAITQELCNMPVPGSDQCRDLGEKYVEKLTKRCVIQRAGGPGEAAEVDEANAIPRTLHRCVVEPPREVFGQVTTQVTALFAPRMALLRQPRGLQVGSHAQAETESQGSHKT